MGIVLPSVAVGTPVRAWLPEPSSAGRSTGRELLVQRFTSRRAVDLCRVDSSLCRVS